MKLAREDLEDLCRGAAFLGTGGGGDPYIGRLMVQQAMDLGKTVDIIDPSEVPDDALVIPTAMMGAPTVLIEKLPRGDEAILSLRRIEKLLGRKAYATMPIEVGGINSTMPLVVGAYADLPVVDADGMGRAFPELQMETFAVYGIPGTPMAITNEYGGLRHRGNPQQLDDGMDCARGHHPHGRRILHRGIRDERCRRQANSGTEHPFAGTENRKVHPRGTPRDTGIPSMPFWNSCPRRPTHTAGSSSRARSWISTARPGQDLRRVALASTVMTVSRA